MTNKTLEEITGKDIRNFSLRQDLAGADPSPVQTQINYTDVVTLVRRLTGKNLTLLEASITNESQLKALKDCFKTNTSDMLNELAEVAFEGKQVSMLAIDPIG